MTEINEFTDLELYNKFCKDAMLDSHRSAWKKRRKDSAIYANILITHPGMTFYNGVGTWWRDYVGLTCFCKLQFRIYRTGEKLIEAFPVKLTNTLIHEGRGIPSDCFSLV